eukprot:gene3270-3751_t
MAFKSRIMSFIGKTDRHGTRDDIKDSDSQNAQISQTADSKANHEDNRAVPEDENTDKEIIKGIEEIYYKPADFDMTEYELKNLPALIDVDQLDGYGDFLRRQSNAVTRQLSRKILENQALYVRELERVIDLQSSLSKATSICMKGRSHLNRAKEEAAMRVLFVLAKHRRKVLQLKLLKSLRFIKTLQRTDVRLKELLQEDDYPTAIQLCLECQKAAETFRQYNCIRELSSDLQETLDQIEEQLDVALSKVCNGFNEKQYQKILSAYMLLGKTQTAMDQLQMHYLSTVNSVALQVVSDHLDQNNLLPTTAADFNFPALCKNIGLANFTSCLVDLCKNFWTVMSSYKQAMNWHEKYDQSLQSKSDEIAILKSPTARNGEEELEKGGVENTSVEAMFDRQYVKSKLEQGLSRIWQDIQHKVKTFVLSTDLAYFKYDDFIRVLDVISKLILIGEDFCGSKSQSLQESIRTQTVNYFKAYHRSTLDELRMFLENEVWELCPVRSNFKILSLQEFEFLKSGMRGSKGHQRSHSGTINPESGFFKDLENNTTTPFDDICEDDSSAEKDDELKMDYVDENTGEETDMRSRERSKRERIISLNTPIISNTTLNVLRSFGKYMQMMSVLKPIAFDVVICMSQLFDYYLYAVYTFFCSTSNEISVELDSNANAAISMKMRMTLKRISNNIILKQGAILNQGDLKVYAPCLSSMVDLSRQQDLCGLSHRIIAMESLVFLANQLKTLHTHLDLLIPVAKRAFLAQFFSQTIDVSEELRTPVYKVVAEKAIAFDQTLAQMSLVKWDIKEIMSQHSSYVDNLTREFQLFSDKVTSVSRNVPVPAEVSCILWTHVIQLSNRTFVDGFSSVKKCSNEGRALMQLDYQQLLIKLERIALVRPIPGREFVEAFIKAFYLSENDLERWLREHTEYTVRQLRSLVTCGTGSHITKKTKNRLMDVLDELDKTRSAR